MSKHVKVKPCPFCGSEDVNQMRWEEWLQCNSCAAEGAAPDDNFADAVSAWNRRAPSPAFEAMVEALEGLVKCCEEHDAAIAKVMGAPPGWKDTYLDAARAAVALARGER